MAAAGALTEAPVTAAFGSLDGALPPSHVIVPVFLPAPQANGGPQPASALGAYENAPNAATPTSALVSRSFFIS